VAVLASKVLGSKMDGNVCTVHSLKIDSCQTTCRVALGRLDVGSHEIQEQDSSGKQGIT
jgi:hypothetical protein